MRRPHWRSAMFTAISGVLGLAILAGCATRQSGLNASDQAARYLQNASGRYPVPGPPGDPWGPYIREASNRYDMPESWIRALMRQESGGQLYRNGRLITSSAGAMGLMQVMPGTYAELRSRHNLGGDPFNPHDNILAGVAYMREMYDMYGSPGFLAAYNAGPNRLDDYLANQRGLPDETRRYVASIGPSLGTAAPRRTSPAQQFAMNQVPLYIPAGTRYAYGQVPSVQLASATTTYRQPVFTAAPVQPTYTPAVAQPAPVYAQAPVVQTPAPQVRSLAWAEPARPAYTAPAQTYEPPQRRVVLARGEEPREERRSTRVAAAKPHHAGNTRVALAIARTSPQRSGGGLHLISSAVAAEVYSARRHKADATPVSYGSKAEHVRAPATTVKLHASGPVQAAPNCHKNSKGKLACS